MNLTIIPTSDGSPTLYSEKYKDTYHSKHGAVQESMHIFVEEGKARSRILEMGFGTGLNALLTGMHAKGPVHYTSIELEPLSKECWRALNYDQDEDIFVKLHEAAWNQDVVITSEFTLRKLQIALEDFTTDDQYDCIYFDAFAPSAQPELWTQLIFKKLYGMLEKRGTLVTYSAKGEVRRSLESVGFHVERLPGPPGKREFLRAVK